MLYRGISIILRRVAHTDAHSTAASLTAETALGLAEHLHRQLLLFVEFQFSAIKETLCNALRAMVVLLRYILLDP